MYRTTLVLACCLLVGCGSCMEDNNALVDMATSDVAATNDVGSDGGRSDVGPDAATTPEFQADFTWSGTPQVGEVLVFDASTTTAPEDADLVYEWIIGNDVRSRGVRTSHIFDERAEFLIILVVTDRTTGETSRHLDVVNVGGDAPALSAFAIDAYVIDRDDQPIEAASILVDGALEATTDAGGRARVDTFAPEEVVLAATADGYTSNSVRLQRPETVEPVEWRAQLKALETSTVTATDGAFEAEIDGVTVSATMGAVTDAEGADATGDFDVSVSFANCEWELLPDAPGLAADGSEVEISPAAAAYIELDPALAYSGAANPITLRVFVCGGLEDEALWHFENGRWVEKPVSDFEVETVFNQQFILIDVDADGWWMVGAPVQRNASAVVACRRGGEVQPCLASVDAAGYSTTVIADGNTEVAVPAGYACIKAQAEGARCTAEQCQTLAANDSATFDLSLECYGDGYPVLLHGDREDFVVSRANGANDGWRFDAQAGDGVVVRFELDVAAMMGELWLKDATGKVHESIPINASSTDYSFAFQIPFDGPWFIELTGTVGTDINATLRVDKVPVLQVDQTYEGLSNQTTPPLEHLVYIDQGQQLINGYLFGEIDGRLTFRDLDGTEHVGAYPIRGLPVGDQEFPDTGLVALPRVGWYLVSVESSGGLSPGAYGISLSQPSETALALTNGQYRGTDDLALAGEHHLYTFGAAAGDGVEVRVLPEGLDPATLVGVRVFRIGNGSIDRPNELVREFHSPAYARLFDEELESIAFRIPVDGLYMLDVTHYAVFDGLAETGGYELRVDHVPASSAITVDDDGSCSGAVESLSAAVKALQPGGLLTICYGHYRLDSPLVVDVDGATIRGMSIVDTSITWVRPEIYEHADRFSALRVDADDVTVEHFTVDREEVGAAVPEGSYIWLGGARPFLYNVGAQHRGGATSSYFKAANNADVTLHECDFSGAANGFSGNFASLELVGNYIQAAGRIASVSGVRAAKVSSNVTNSGDGFYLSHPGTGMVDIEISWNGMTVTGDGATALHVGHEGGNDARPRTVAIAHNIVDATGSLSGALSITPQNATTSYLVNANRLEASSNHVVSVVAGTATVAPPWGAVDFTNNVVTGYSGDYSALYVVDPYDFSSFDILHNTMQSDPAVTTGDDVAITLQTSSAGTATLPLRFQNNIVAGEGGNGLAIAGVGTGYTVEGGGNLFWNVDGYGSEVTSRSGTELSSADPVFTDAVLRVDPNSPAVDAIACHPDVTQDYDRLARPTGLACDAGAHEQ